MELIVNFLLTMLAGTIAGLAAAWLLLHKAAGMEISLPEIGGKLDAVIDQRLNQLVLNLQKQIPMAAAFLTGALAEKLKGQAKEEFKGALPEMAQILSGDLKKKMFESEAWNIMRKKALLAGAVVGAMAGTVFGLLQAVLLTR